MPDRGDVLVPRGPLGKLGGKILGCRELVVLHDAHGHPLLATTHRGDQHLTIGLPSLLQRYEQATGQVHKQRQEDLQAQARDMYELDHSKDQIMTLLRVGLANLGMWVAAFVTLFPTGRVDHYDSERGATDVCAFNNWALRRDLEKVSRNVNSSGAILPDGRRLVVTVGERLRTHALNGPLARTG